MERWALIKELNCKYEISSLGRVRNIKTKKILKPRLNKFGYVKYGFSQNNKYICLSQHRLIAIYFIPNPENKRFVDHINTIRHDNRITNLRWVTPRENCYLNTTHKRNHKHKKITMDDINDMYILSKTKSGAQIGKIYNIPKATINHFLIYLHPDY